MNTLPYFIFSVNPDKIQESRERLNLTEKLDQLVKKKFEIEMEIDRTVNGLNMLQERPGHYFSIKSFSNGRR